MAIRYSGHTLIPHLNVLQNFYLHEKPLNEDQFRTLYYDLELLPYTLGLCWYSVTDLAKTQHELSLAFSDEAFKESTIHGLGDEARDRMTYAIDAFLDAARRSQNAVIYYIRRELGKQLPLSMNKLVKGIRAGSIQLPDGLQAGILKYWDEHGLRLKQYRDLAQHHALVTSDVRLFQGSNGERAMYFVLPSNPEVASPARLLFGSPSVQAFPYVANQFLHLVSHIHWVTAAMAHGVSGRMALIVFRDGVSLDLTGHPVPTEETVATKVEELREALKGRM